MEDTDALDTQEEIRRAISALRLAQEILARLATAPDDSMQTLIRERADALGNRLTGVELAVVARFLMGESPEAIARERGLSDRTVSNQIRSGRHKLGFSDRREMKGWSTAARGFILTRTAEN